MRHRAFFRASPGDTALAVDGARRRYAEPRVAPRGPRLPGPGPITTFSCPTSHGTLTAVASRGGQEIGRKTLTTTGRHGQTLAILRPGKAQGTMTLAATANGLAPAIVSLPVATPAAPAAKPGLLVSYDGRRASRGGVLVAPSGAGAPLRKVSVELRASDGSERRVALVVLGRACGSRPS